MLVLWGDGKTNVSTEKRNDNKLHSFYGVNAGSWTQAMLGRYWWKARALTTSPPLLSINNINFDLNLWQVLDCVTFQKYYIDVLQ